MPHDVEEDSCQGDLKEDKANDIEDIGNDTAGYRGSATLLPIKKPMEKLCAGCTGRVRVTNG